jgi:tetratricopeptide (TPR) repeat protein
MFGLSNKPKKIEGDIGYFHLEEWWLSEFDESTREYIVEKYQPMGSPPRCLVEGKYEWTSATPASLLSGLGGWFQGSTDRHIARKIYQKALDLVDASNDPLDRHFLYQGLIETYYKDRENPEYYNLAIEYCKKQILMQKEAAKKWKEDYPGDSLPSHHGYEQYAIILEKEKRYDEAIELSREAERNGWAGSWKNRIERCEKKIEKSKS